MTQETKDHMDTERSALDDLSSAAFNRRKFLIGSGLAAGLAVLTAACGNDDEVESGGSGDAVPDTTPEGAAEFVKTAMAHHQQPSTRHKVLKRRWSAILNYVLGEYPVPDTLRQDREGGEAGVGQQDRSRRTPPRAELRCVTALFPLRRVSNMCTMRR